LSVREDEDEDGALKMASKLKQLTKLLSGLADVQETLKSDEGVRKRARVAFAKLEDMSDNLRSPIRVGGVAMTKRIGKIRNGASGIFAALRTDDLTISDAKAELRGLTKEIGSFIEDAQEETDRVKLQVKALTVEEPKKEEAAPKPVPLARSNKIVKSLSELEKLIHADAEEQFAAITAKVTAEEPEEDVEEETASDEVHPARQILSKYSREERQLKAVKLTDAPGHNFTFLYLPLVVLLEHPLSARAIENSRFKIVPLSGVRDKHGKTMTPYINQHSAEDYNTSYVFENQLVVLTHKSVPEDARKRETLTKRHQNDNPGKKATEDSDAVPAHKSKSIKERKLRGQDERLTRQDILKLIEHNTKTQSLVDVLSGDDEVGLYSTAEITANWMMPSAQVKAMNLSSIMEVSFPWVQVKRILPDHTKKSRNSATKKLQTKTGKLRNVREEFEDEFAKDPENLKFLAIIEKAEEDLEKTDASIEKIEKAINNIKRDIEIIDKRLPSLQGKEKSKDLQSKTDFEIAQKDRKAKREKLLEDKKRLKGEILQARAKRRALHDKRRDEYREEGSAAD
jgi:DNA repair exonuclease SbcCD ATPase subunit